MKQNKIVYVTCLKLQKSTKKAFKVKHILHLPYFGNNLAFSSNILIHFLSLLIRLWRPMAPGWLQVNNKTGHTEFKRFLLAVS